MAICENCKSENGTEELHLCSYSIEVYPPDDYEEKMCNCCEECTRECALST